MCVTRFDSLRLPGYTCSLADGSPLATSMRGTRPARRRRALPVESAPRQLSWRDVAAGMMLVNGVLEKRAVGGRASLERGLLRRAQSTWMPQAPELELLFMTSCAQDEDQPAPTWWAPAQQQQPQRPPTTAPVLPTVLWRCYRGQDRLGQSLWRKTGALLATLHARFPRKSFYLKLDSDTMVFPHALLRFLQALHSGSPRARPLYFGSNRIAARTYFGGALFASAPWRQLERAVVRASLEGALTTARHNRSGLACESDGASYAQGGAYGFSWSALRALVGATGGARTDTAAGASSAAGAPSGSRLRLGDGARLGDGRRLLGSGRRLSASMSSRASARLSATASGAGHARERPVDPSDAPCLSAVAQAVAQYTQRERPQLFEDEAVGLCMHLHRVRRASRRASRLAPRPLGPMGG